MKVLLGIGGSDDSIRALEAVVARAAAVGDDLTIAIVENPRSPRSREEIAERAREELEGAGIDAPIRQVEGNPGSELVDIAERGAFDEIALGGGQTSPMGKINVGSIAEFVLLNARTTVRLIR
ncbi:universal stress protein [Halolamina salifodinae]|uniref:Nucleotide-binding universal stress UspA family protein n=1 Tax=Halolamina salifodinae TaxID=1202767 RepID=A0A8T4H557_9EURY|nr:universal stress protein [Halolamina salifodinae]MBP1988258.1 nucleotide-binding universal stress UspA family protein [Halolamina salifodinae]